MSTFDFLEFRHLKYVEAIAVAERFTTAANHLHTSQSSLSTQIKQLEEYFNVQIFIRGRDGVAGLTAAGQVLVAGAKELLHLRDETINIMLALGTGTPPALRIGFSSLVEKKLLHAMVDLIRALMPTSEVKCDVDDLENLKLRVRSGELDTALITLPLEDSPEIRTYVVEKEPLVVCMRSESTCRPGDHTGTRAERPSRPVRVSAGASPRAHASSRDVVPVQCDAERVSSHAES